MSTHTHRSCKGPPLLMKISRTHNHQKHQWLLDVQEIKLDTVILDDATVHQVKSLWSALAMLTRLRTVSVVVCDIFGPDFQEQTSAVFLQSVSSITQVR